jgi:hypothetical protein
MAAAQARISRFSGEKYSDQNRMAANCRVVDVPAKIVRK